MQIRPRTGLLLTTFALLAPVAAGLVYASIPGADGVIYACRHKMSGALRVIDSTANCNAATEEPLNWSQAGSPGPSDAYYAANEFMRVGPADTTLASVVVPAGSYTVSAKTHLYNMLENSFAVCELRAGASPIDANILRLIAPANDQVVPFFGVASLPAGGSIALVCSGNGVTTVESESTRVVATRIGTLH